MRKFFIGIVCLITTTGIAQEDEPINWVNDNLIPIGIESYKALNSMYDR